MNSSPTPSIDEELAALQAGRTSAACAKIVALHGALVKAACRRVLRDEGLAEDAAQETFVLLVKKARSLPPTTPLAGWLYHAACRTALNHQRSAMRRRVRENSAEALNQMTPDTQPDLWNEIEPHLDEAMLGLPERQRDLVLQCYFQNQSQRSAAASLGCSESLVSRELSTAIETLRQFFTKRRITISSVALTSLLSSRAATATITGSAALVGAMMATTTTTTSALVAAALQSKIALSAAAMLAALTAVIVGYHTASSTSSTADTLTGTSAQGANGTTDTVDAKGVESSAKYKVVYGPGASGGKGGAPGTWQGKWDASFQFTSAMALDAKKKEVLLEGNADARFALLQQMGVKLSRAAFDALIAKGMDASVAPWRDTFAVLTNRTDGFDSYLMAWSNEDPLAALNWVAAQPDGGSGMRKQLIYALQAGQLDPSSLRDWIGSLSSKSLQQEAMLALDSMRDPASLIARMGTGGNDGFLVDLALLHGDQIDWSAFGRKLATAKSFTVARAMRQIMEGEVSQQQVDLMLQELARSADPNINTGAVTILRAARGDASVDYLSALNLDALADKAGMGSFKTSIFQGWAAAHPEAAVQYAASLRDLASLRDVMHALPGPPDEATLLAWLANSPEKARDIALSRLYGRSSEDSFTQLNRILRSPYIADQVEAAKEMLRMMPLADAPAALRWFNELPPGKDRWEMVLPLATKLAAVDPQAALQLILSEPPRGKDYENSITQAVTQLAAQNGLTQATQAIQQIKDPKSYAQALGQLAMVKFAGHPQEAFAYLQANSRGDWQPAALRMLSELQYNKLGNVDSNAAEILKLDLPRLGSDVGLRAAALCKIWIDQQAPFTKPLEWVQQLPPTMARDARLQLAKIPNLKPAAVQQYQQWLKTAPIPQAERNKLLTALANRPSTYIAK